jgi:hypothetical protein
LKEAVPEIPPALPFSKGGGHFSPALKNNFDFSALGRAKILQS